MILIPVKNLKEAKQRLASVLDQPERTELARAMLQDVADAVAAKVARSNSWADRFPFLRRKN